MPPVIIAVIIGIAVYAVIVALIPKHILADTSQYTRQMLQKLSRDRPIQETEETYSVLRSETEAKNFFSSIFYTMPLADAGRGRLLRAGLAKQIEPFFLSCIAVFLITIYFAKPLGFIAFPAAILMSYVFAFWFIRRRINKRNIAFLRDFPDALDIIVRSVRSGYPINAAIRMVAENMPAPVSTEFKQVADEINFGSSLIEAMQRLSYRIDEQDVRFFVIVLNVQQEVGGNLSEVLNNLSNIIRKRKHLRLKVKALAAEGRATAWVLGSMPLVEASLISIISPDHLTPLFTTSLGNTILGLTIGIVALGIFIVRQLINIRV